MSSPRNTLVIAALFVSALAAPSRLLAQTPAPVDIGSLGGGSAVATAAADGYVAGVSTTPGGESHLFVWSAATHTMRDINADISAFVPDMGYSAITSVNSSGEAVGAAWDTNFTAMTGFYWSPTGAVSLGSLYPNVQQTAVLINEHGVVAGVTADNQLFRWTRASGFEYLGTPPAGNYPYLSGINGNGDIAGGGASGPAFVALGSSNTLTTLASPGSTVPPPGATSGGGNVAIQVNGINDSGVVVGQYWDAEWIVCGYDISQGGFYCNDIHNSHPFEWTAGGGFTDLGSLSTTGAIGGSANAISNSGVIVGYSYVTNPPFVYSAFSYQASGPMTALQSLPGASYGQAFSVNDDGVVTGYSDSCGCNAVVWMNGAPQSIVPSFAPNFPSVRVTGHMLWGNGLSTNWVQHAWTMGLVSADTTPPTVHVVPGDQTVEATGPNGAVITFSATATDPDDAAGPVTCTQPSGSTFALGTTTVVCSATDTHHNTGSASFAVTVRDTTPPVISQVTPSRSMLWPPNHQMVPITVTVTATDIVGVASLKIVSVTSSEPDNGLGDGDTAGDIAITGPLTVNLRAERAGNGNGRTYTIVVEARDAAGNATTRTTTVLVPKSQGK